MKNVIGGAPSVTLDYATVAIPTLYFPIHKTVKSTHISPEERYVV